MNIPPMERVPTLKPAEPPNRMIADPVHGVFVWLLKPAPLWITAPYISVLVYIAVELMRNA
jgi:hypothetical protein